MFVHMDVFFIKTYSIGTTNIGAPWMDPGHQAAALAAAHHHPHIHQHSHQHQHNPVLDGYPPEYGLIR